MEPLNKETHDKFDTVGAIIDLVCSGDRIDHLDRFPPVADRLSDISRTLRVQLYDIQARYALSTSSTLLDGLSHRGKTSCGETIIGAYHRQISILDIDFHLGGLVATATEGWAPPDPAAGKRMVSLKRSFEHLIRNGRLSKLESEIYNRCSSCQVVMCVDTNRSELRCPLCNRVKLLMGTVFDDCQLYNQEGQKAKSGRFRPNIHCDMWVIHIQAKEPEEELEDKDDSGDVCGVNTLASIKRIIARDNKILMLMTVDDFRAILKELGRTELYRNVPLIMKKLSGMAPPPLDDVVVQKTMNIFSKIVELGGGEVRKGRQNHDYYPFYLFKILDFILPENDRQRRILYYIYLQGEDTVARDDIEWRGICDRISIKYKPTDRTVATKYCPANFMP